MSAEQELMFAAKDLERKSIALASAVAEAASRAKSNGETMISLNDLATALAEFDKAKLAHRVATDIATRKTLRSRW